jgi:hypothetical protein
MLGGRRVVGKLAGHEEVKKSNSDQRVGHTTIFTIFELEETVPAKTLTDL